MAGDPLAFDDAVRLLQSGGVLLLGTDTLPGFHCRADLPASVDRILTLKGRSPGKSLLVLAGSVEQTSLVTGPLEGRQSSYCARCWPGPFSLILPSGGELAPQVKAANGTVAVRVPAVPSLRDLILEVGFPVVSTSANLSGQPPSGNLETACRAFSDQVNGSWQPPENVPVDSNKEQPGPSALIDLTVWPPVELRPGPQKAPQPE